MNWDLIIQSATLLVLAATVYESHRGLKVATEQARSSEAQAKSSEQMARLSLRQTELMRAQLHAAFKPVVEVVAGEYGINCVMLTLKNVGNSLALVVSAVCRNGWRENLGTLAPGEMREFRFDNSFQQEPPQPVGSSAYQEQFKREIQPVPLRLEYQSVCEVKCWTNVDFPVGHDGAFEAQNEHGKDLPSLNSGL